MLQTNNTAVCSQCLSHTGPAPVHDVCSLPAHTTQALGCSAGNRPRPALGCMHLPGLSRSGSGTLVVLRGADSIGPALTHSECDLPAHTAQALGCSARNCLRCTLGCMHFPVLNHSGSGSRILHKGQTWLGLCFVPFPGPSSSDDQVFGECGRCDLSPPRSLPLGFLGVQPAHLLRRMLTLQNPKKS